MLLKTNICEKSDKIIDNWYSKLKKIFHVVKYINSKTYETNHRYPLKASNIFLNDSQQVQDMLRKLLKINH